MNRKTAKIAYCPRHGLHGERDVCFNCAEVVGQIPMAEIREGEIVVSLQVLEDILPYVGSMNGVPGESAYRELKKVIEKATGSYKPNFTQDLIDSLETAPSSVSTHDLAEKVITDLIAEGWTWIHETEPGSDLKFSTETHAELHKALSEKFYSMQSGSWSDYALIALKFLSDNGYLKQP